MKTLVWVEHDGSAVKDATLAAVTAASKLGEVHLLVAGSGVDGVAKTAAGIAGVGKVHVADNAAFVFSKAAAGPLASAKASRLKVSPFSFSPSTILRSAIDPLGTVTASTRYLLA